MQQVVFKGQKIKLYGILPNKGRAAPDFSLTNSQLAEVSLSDFKHTPLILNIFPSIDTPTCASSVRQFNQQAAATDAKILCISMDLPFAQQRFCAAEGFDHVICLSAFREPAFGRDYGIEIGAGPLRGLLARAIVAISATGKVAYTELVSDIADEPDYAAALKAV